MHCRELSHQFGGSTTGRQAPKQVALNTSGNLSNTNSSLFLQNVHSFVPRGVHIAYNPKNAYHSQKSMLRKRSAQNLTTSQVARLLGVAKKTLYRMLQQGRVPEPMRNPDNNYRIWIPQQVEAIREELEK